MATQWKYGLVSCVACLVWGMRTAQISVDDDDGGYKGVVVAFKWSIAEDKEFIPKIQKIFTDASDTLYQSTREYHYFKEIIIAIPASWPNSDQYEMVNSDLFKSAAFRVDHPNQEHGDEPFTLQPDDCGKPGEYVQVSPQYLLTSKYTSKRSEYEIQHIRMVHEWSHLRYGVFDEFGLPGSKKYPIIYWPDGSKTWKVTGCTDKVQASLLTEEGICDFENNEGIGSVPKEDCFALPTEVGATDYIASIMFTANINKVVHYCDKGDQSGEERRHNDDAQNKQNDLCSYRSTWEVVSEHEDFKTRKQQIPLSTVPLFRIVRTPVNAEGRYVLVLDISHSMKGKPLDLLNIAAARFLQDKVQSGSEVGIVTFSDSAHIVEAMTKVTEETRSTLINSLPKRTEAYTAIGKGLQMALSVLKQKGEKAEGAIILLITDGEENIGPTIMDVLPELVREKVIVNAIGISDKASQKLEHMISATNGKLFIVDNVNDANAISSIDIAFQDSIIAQAHEDFQPVTIAHEVLQVVDTLETNVYLDEELGKNTVFSWSAFNISKIEINISDPFEHWTTPSSSNYDIKTGLNRILATFPSGSPGLWKAFIKNKNSRPIMIDFTATSEPNDPKLQPIRARAWFDDVEVSYPKPVKLFSHVTKGSSAVKEANVIATVGRPDGSTIHVPLRDDEADPDTSKDDGIYTNYFTDFAGNGRYSVVVNVETKALIRGKRVPRSTDEDRGIYSSRVANPGVFKVTNWTSTIGDVIPPSKITDLILVASEYQNEEANVTLSWTSPGNDMNSGTVQSLDLRVSGNFSEIRHQFEFCHVVENESSFVNGSLRPRLAGTKHEVTIRIPYHLLPGEWPDVRVLYFGVRGRDESGNIAPVSNVARAYLQRTAPDDQKDSILTASNDLLIGVIVACVVLFCFVFVAVLVKCLFFRRKNQIVYHGVRTDPELPRFLTNTLHVKGDAIL